MIVGYVSWGEKITFYIETCFSIISVLPDPAVDGITVLTDHPGMFRMFDGNAKVTIAPLPTETFHEWYGEWHYLFRAKIKGIQKLVELNPGNDLLFLDSDTFRGGDLAPVRECLANGGLCMHDFHGRLKDKPVVSNSWKKFWRGVGNRNWDGIEIGDDLAHRNSGCLGFPAGRAKELLDKALRLNDAILKAWKGKSPVHSTEEGVFSMVMDNAGEVMDISGIIGHYYRYKEVWQAEISEFLAKSRMNNNTLAEDIEAVKKFDFKTTPLDVHIPRWRKRTNRVMTRLLPDKRVRHFPDPYAIRY